MSKDILSGGPIQWGWINIGLSLSSGGTALVYSPNATRGTVFAPFNGGPAAGSTLPQIQVQILNQVAGDIVGFTSSSLSGVTLQVLNGGVGAARVVNVLVKGY